MNLQHPDQPYSAPAAVDTNQFRFLDFNASGQVVYPAAGAMAVAVSDGEDGGLRLVKAGRQVRYFWDGVLKLEYGGNIAAGARVAVGASGKAVTAAPGNVIVGVAIDAGVNGDLGEIQFLRFLGVAP